MANIPIIACAPKYVHPLHLSKPKGVSKNKNVNIVPNQ